MSVVFVVICPAVYFRNLSLPVSVTGTDRCGPLQRGRAPRVECCHLAALPDADEEVEHKQELCQEHYQRHYAYEAVYALELLERLPCRVVIITTRHTGNTFIVHRPEDKVGADKSNKEVDVAQRVVHKAPEHLREPVIHTGKHAEERRYTHYYVEVRNYEVRIVQVNVDSRVTKEDTCETAGDKQRHEAKGK